MQHVVNDLREYVNGNDLKISNQQIGMPLLVEQPLNTSSVTTGGHDRGDPSERYDYIVTENRPRDQTVQRKDLSNIKVIHTKDKKTDKIKSLLRREDVSPHDLRNNEGKLRRSLLKQAIGF